MKKIYYYILIFTTYLFAACTNEYSDAISSEQCILLNIEDYKFPERNNADLATRTTTLYHNGYNEDYISKSDTWKEKDSHADSWTPRWEYDTYESFKADYRDVWEVGDEIGIFAGSHYELPAKKITVTAQSFKDPLYNNFAHLTTTFNSYEKFNGEDINNDTQSTFVFLRNSLDNFTLYEGEKYFVYYPYRENTKPTEIPFDISNQIQKGNDNIDHLKGKEHTYLCTMKHNNAAEDSPYYSVCTGKGLLTGVCHPTAIFRFCFGKLPEGFKGRSVTMKCIQGGQPKAVFTETGTLDAYNNGTITGTPKSSVSIALQDASGNVGMPVDKNGMLFVHMQVAPAKTNDCILEITLEGTDDTKYQVYRTLELYNNLADGTLVITKEIEAGNFYNYNCWTREYFTQLNPAYENHMKDDPKWKKLFNFEQFGCSHCYEYDHVNTWYHFLRPSTEYTH